MAGGFPGAATRAEWSALNISHINVAERALMISHILTVFLVIFVIPVDISPHVVTHFELLFY